MEPISGDVFGEVELEDGPTLVQIWTGVMLDGDEASQILRLESGSWTADAVVTVEEMRALAEMLVAVADETDERRAVREAVVDEAGLMSGERFDELALAGDPEFAALAGEAARALKELGAHKSSMASERLAAIFERRGDLGG